MAREHRQDVSVRAWSAAALIAAGAMMAWLAWHAIDSVRTLDQLRQDHAEAARQHDAILRLEADIQRTAQLAIVTAEPEWLVRYAETDEDLRSLLTALQLSAPGESRELEEALASLDRMRETKRAALSLLAEGSPDEAFSLLAGPDFEAATQSLGRVLRVFDHSNHDLLLARSLGLTRSEIYSLLGALVLFTLAISAWLLLVKRLSREKSMLRNEMEARGRAEAELLRAHKFEILGELSGTVAHDVDNMLSAVAGYTSLAERAGDQAARDSALAGLKRAVQQGRALTHNLLSLVGHGGAARERLELREFVAQAGRWLSPLLPENTFLSLAVETDGPVWIEANPIQMQQALMNLALNAKDAMPQGGNIKLRLCRRPPTGDRPEAGAALACIGISDTGHGMDEDTQRRAREPFFSTKPKGRGTGLGLVSVERFVQSLGGQLEIESAPGAGTQVRLLIPEQPGPVTEECKERPRVALASPDGPWRNHFAHALEEAGLAVELADGLQRAPPFATAVRDAALLVLDWRERAAEAVPRLRALRRNGLRQPVVLLTDQGLPGVDRKLDSELAELALVVSRAAPADQVARLALRLAAGRSS